MKRPRDPFAVLVFAGASLLLAGGFTSGSLREQMATAAWLTLLAVALSIVVGLAYDEGAPKNVETAPLFRFVRLANDAFAALASASFIRRRRRKPNVRQTRGNDLATYEANYRSINGMDGIVQELMLRLGTAERSFWACGPNIDADSAGVNLAEAYGWSGTFVDTERCTESEAVSRLLQSSARNIGFMEVRARPYSALSEAALKSAADVVALSCTPGARTRPWSGRMLRRAHKNAAASGRTLCGIDSRARVAYFVRSELSELAGFVPQWRYVARWERG